MTPAARLLPSVTGFRVALAASAIGYTAWRYWHNRNQQNRAAWAAGTDTVE